MKKILISVGTRPNFIKVTQFNKIVSLFPEFKVILVHTGQHYDIKMADVFFNQFNLTPDYFLDIHPDKPYKQIAEIMIRMGQLVKDIKPDIIMVPGDVNSTLAVALTANKMNIPLAHIESGLRSFDYNMPEEYNRLITDQLADICFVTEKSGTDNLLRERKPQNSIYFVGNTMIDTLVGFEDSIENSEIMLKHKLEPEKYVLMTMHRPATVDSKIRLTELIYVIESICRNFILVFPVHPRTYNRFKEFGLDGRLDTIRNLLIVPPLDYFSFQKLIKNAFAIITDSGGIQEESTYYGVNCLTLRENTERPVTIELGTNRLLHLDSEAICNALDSISMHKNDKAIIPPLWDGKATFRILDVLKQYFND